MSLHEMARRMVAVALAAVDPERLVREALAGRPERWGAVLALGKAAPAMARGAAAGALAPAASRLLVRTHGAPALLDPAWEQLSGGHPVSDRMSLAAGRRAMEWLGGLPAEAPLLALVSGGSSACIDMLADDLTLEELIATQRALLASGLPIHAFNAVRKHLSLFKAGGALRASRASRATGLGGSGGPGDPGGSGGPGAGWRPVVALLLSDVPGDDPGTIGSGPFAADPTTFADALAAVAGLDVPERVRRRLAAGARGELPETLKAGDPALARVDERVLAGAGTAAAAVAAEARRADFAAEVGGLAGEAAAVGQALVERGRALEGSRVALVLGGETTVTLGPSPGRGGRNLELALAAARALAGSQGELVLTLATDGEDGPTRFAGALVDGGSWPAMERGGWYPAAALARHDSQTALAALSGALLETGITGTNTGDLAIYLRA